MELEFELPIGEVDETKVEAGGKIPAGWYLATIKDCFADAANDCIKVEYEIASGAYAGKSVSDSVWDPSTEMDAKKSKKRLDRLLMIAGRIGARDEGTAKFNFLRPIGRTVVLHLEMQQECVCSVCKLDAPTGENRPKQCQSCGGKWKWQDKANGFVNPAYDGVYPLDHEKLSDEVRKQLGITVPRRVKGATPGAVPPPAQDIGTLFDGNTSSASAAASPVRPVPPIDPAARLAAATADF